MNDAENPLVSIVVVSFRGGTMLEQCLESLEKQDCTDKEIVVVDNGSGMDLAGKLAKDHRTCRWVTEPHNLGFAGGTNRGIAAAKGRLIALVNDDAVLAPNWITEMTALMRANPTAGAAAGLVIDGNQPSLLDSFGVGVSLDGMSRQLECGEPANIPRSVKSVLAFSGCSCILRRAALKEVGLFDERFFAYCEDTDLSLRLIRSGWQILACPSARSTHYYSHTGGRFSLKKLYLIERNHQWVALRNFPLPVLMLFPFATLWRFAVQIIASRRKSSPVSGFISNGLLKVAWTLLRADLSAASRVPEILLSRIGGRQGKDMSMLQYTRILAANRMPISSVLLSGASSPPENQPK